MIEREVKIPITDLATLQPRLESMGATFEGSEHEVNHILDTPEGALQRRRQLLRVRTANKNTVTWKGQSDQEDSYGHKVREELEISFDADGADTMLTLFDRLGFAEVLRYEKQRATWRWQSVTIALDHLDFGDYIEIEGEAGAIQHALRLLELEGEPRETRSYPELQRQAQQERTRHN